MEEPTVEIMMWTTTREEALKNVTKETMGDEGYLSPQVLDSNQQKYKEVMSSLTLRDATEEEYRKAKGMRQPYRGMTRPFWQNGRFAKVTEEVHAAYLLEKWINMEARNQKRFIAAVGGLTVEEFKMLETKAKEALRQRYDAEMFEVLKYGSIWRIFTGGNAVVWPESFLNVWYYYEMEK